MFSGSSAALLGRAQRQADVGRADDLAGEHADGLADLRAEHRAAHGAHHADQRAYHGLHLFRQDVAHRVPDALGDRIDQLPPRGQGRLDPLRAAPGQGGVRTGRQGGGVVQPQVGQPDRVLHGPALGGADAGVLGALRGALGDRLAGDLLGHVPVHRAALVGEHLAELLERGAQIARVHRPEHRGERIVRAGAAKAARPGRAEAERVGRALTTAALRVLLLAFVAVVRLLRRKAESEWGVTHGFPRLVGPPVLSGGTAARQHHPA